jgi:hypothetical protein
MSDQDNPAGADERARTRLITGLRLLANFLEAHPELPAPQGIRAQHSIVHTYDPKTYALVPKSDEEKIGIAVRAAAVLGVKAVIDEDSVTVDYPVAPRIDYVVHASINRGEVKS